MKKSLVPLKLSKKNKIARSIWNLTYIIFFRYTPRGFHGWRRFLLRLFGADLGLNTHVYPTAKIWAPWNLEMHDDSGIGEHVDVYSVDKIILKKGAAVSQYSFLCTATHNYKKLNLPLVCAPIEIGEYAWITADVFIGPGVTIGDGTVVLSRSSVFNDVDKWLVVSGNPLVVIKKRILES